MTTINSKEYWDSRFDVNWETAGGKNQTRFFMRMLLENLPEEVCKYIKDGSPFILDWGCALGQGVEEISKRFSNAHVTGLDFSETAVKKCKADYPSGNFRSEILDPQKDRFNVIISSNCLEHFPNPAEVFAQHLLSTGQYYILLVPYNEKPPICPEHQIILSENSFPSEINGFGRCFLKIINSQNKGCWCGQQMLMIYKRLSAAQNNSDP
ncbi:MULTISPECIES: class I SAM-dependent methyltransferase [Dehalobacter]|jgi:trans-aconitate methyltransferase|uniref:Methyltransferase domain-containing protein n=2 Tax=Dehalobacter restrictus TaxID=55583 RepID=A0A857DFV8_9FIRM|nr:MULTISPECIES: class I SAM-dependent methyltransferase [Dehalobacter]AHF09002.1 methyltransferase [Dehalobacter restrictus DSM 9455]MCG1024997.1 class I SAM-dependent methyltransferase [Dehalobacter sp.]OCZ53678.1 methyltransferase [Dehalobacter sp. TeCB1]QGZ99527.1 methyltransferase domain-containing protein [Dehalobacter restrictus]